MARTFKTKRFAKDAKAEGITDDDLCEAIRQAKLGQCDNLGGGVFKKRLNSGDHRSIILAKGGQYWIYAYLFAKQNTANIEPDELKTFKELAKLFAKYSDEDITKATNSRALVEICQDGTQNQKDNVDKTSNVGKASKKKI